MVKSTKDWIESVQYDLATAKALLKAKRKIYVIFMCHLAIEKMLKAVFSERFRKLAPYTHNLVYLVNLLELTPPEELIKFIELLNDKSIVTRYPENVSKMDRAFTGKAAHEYLQKTERVIKWLKQNIPSQK